MKKRTMVMVGKATTFADAADDELLFWLAKSIQERLEETERLRKMIWGHLLGSYPKKIEKVGAVVKKDW